jgi:hypothetical protein
LVPGAAGTLVARRLDLHVLDHVLEEFAQVRRSGT